MDADYERQRLARFRQRCDRTDTRKPGKRVPEDTDESALGGIEHKPNQRMDPPAATFFSFVLPYQVQAVSFVKSHRSDRSVTCTRWGLGALQINKQVMCDFCSGRQSSAAQHAVSMSLFLDPKLRSRFKGEVLFRSAGRGDGLSRRSWTWTTEQRTTMKLSEIH